MKKIGREGSIYYKVLILPSYKSSFQNWNAINCQHPFVAADIPPRLRSKHNPMRKVQRGS